LTKSKHPSALYLSILAGKIERNLLAPDEAKQIADLFRRIADGESFDEIFGVHRLARRPNLGKTEHYVQQIHGLTSDFYSHKEKKFISGLSIKNAIESVAEACNVSINSVKRAYYSKSGRKYFLEITAALNKQQMD
jgi:hypothetical protein